MLTYLNTIMQDHHHALNPKHAGTTWTCILLRSKHHINFRPSMNKLNFSKILRGNVLSETQTELCTLKFTAFELLVLFFSLGTFIALHRHACALSRSPSGGLAHPRWKCKSLLAIGLALAPSLSHSCSI
jgi:hypothetical protein